MEIFTIEGVTDQNASLIGKHLYDKPDEEVEVRIAVSPLVPDVCFRMGIIIGYLDGRPSLYGKETPWRVYNVMKISEGIEEKSVSSTSFEVTNNGEKPQYMKWMARWAIDWRSIHDLRVGMAIYKAAHQMAIDFIDDEKFAEPVNHHLRTVFGADLHYFRSEDYTGKAGSLAISSLLKCLGIIKKAHDKTAPAMMRAAAKKKRSKAK